jgi:hypothetical protein
VDDQGGVLDVHEPTVRRLVRALFEIAGVQLLGVRLQWLAVIRASATSMVPAARRRPCVPC